MAGDGENLDASKAPGGAPQKGAKTDGGSLSQRVLNEAPHGNRADVPDRLNDEQAAGLLLRGLGKASESPGQPAPAEQHAAQAAKDGTATSQAAPQPRIENPWQFGNESGIKSALSARLAYLGLKGELIIDKSKAVSMVEGTGPLGQQLAQRVTAMEAHGWTIGRMPLNDPYMSRAFKNPISRYLMYPMIGGYNAPAHEGVPIKRVTYNSWSHLFNQGLSSFGPASPATRVAGNLAHELGHWDRVPLPEVSQLKGLSLAEQQVVARRLLQTETNAILPQLYVSQRLGAYHTDIEIFREALKSGRLGSLIRNRWINAGSIYNTFEHISPKEADAFVKDLLDTNYKGVVKPNGVINDYDLGSIRGKYVGQTSLDASILQRLDDPARGVAVAENSLIRGFQQTGHGPGMLRGANALAGLGIAVMGTDIAAGFYESNERGFGKIGRAATSWGAYEVGSVAGAKLGAPMTRLALRSKYGAYILPIAAISAGVLSTTMVDMKYGKEIEDAIKEALTPMKPEDRLRETFLRNQ